MADPVFGTISFYGERIRVDHVLFDKIAVDADDNIYALSVMAPSKIVKQIRTALNGKDKTLRITAGGQKVHLWGNIRKTGKGLGHIKPHADKYDGYVHRLDHGMAHALFLCRKVGFMTSVNHESLWAELSKDRFTTPIVREWMPYVDSVLRVGRENEGMFAALSCHGCSCGVLHLDTRKLDRIIEHGLRTNQISIPRDLGRQAGVA